MDRSGAFSISADTVYPRLGTATAPLLLDVRERTEAEDDGAQIIGAVRRPPEDAHLWHAQLPQGRVIVLYCQDGTDNGPRLTQWLINGGVEALYLDGGMDEWRRKGFATRRRTGQMPTHWVTCERPKVDRIACPWLVRRFIDPEAIFHYMPPAKVRGSARSGAVAYDVDGAEFGHHGDKCSFDAFLTLFQIEHPALDRLAVIVRGANTGIPELTPQSPGLVALSQGLSMTIGDDMVQLEHCRAQE
jgi:rhodanese-related sulfurtransferase